MVSGSQESSGTLPYRINSESAFTESPGRFRVSDPLGGLRVPYVIRNTFSRIHPDDRFDIEDSGNAETRGTLVAVVTRSSDMPE